MNTQPLLRRRAKAAGVALLAGIGILGGGGMAQAQRPATPSMSCAETSALVNRAGAVVLTTGPTTYDRYVRDVSFCYVGEQLKPEWVRTRDAQQCFIGYTCFIPSRGDYSR